MEKGVRVTFREAGRLEWPCDEPSCAARQICGKCCKSKPAHAAANALAQLVNMEGGLWGRDHEVKQALLNANGDVRATAEALAMMPMDFVDSLIRLLAERHV